MIRVPIFKAGDTVTTKMLEVITKSINELQGISITGGQHPARIVGHTIIVDTISSIPTGTVLPYAPESAIPDGFLECDGAAVSRDTYANLFDAIGTVYGVGDGSTTFNVPDLDGMFLRFTKAAGHGDGGGEAIHGGGTNDHDDHTTDTVATATTGITVVTSKTHSQTTNIPPNVLMAAMIKT